LDLHTAARGILAIANSNMVGAIRVVSVERGHHPRDFALVAFGGAGPLHGTALAGLLGIATVLIPPAPGLLCAEGLLAADLKAEFHRTPPMTGAPDGAVANPMLDGLRAEADAWLAAEHVPVADRMFEALALLRYHGQGGELAVPWTGTASAAVAAFHASHQTLYGFTMDTPVELVTLRVEATGRMPVLAARLLDRLPPPAVVEERPVHFVSGTVTTPVFARDELGAGAAFGGPAIITQLDATTLVPPGWHVEVHATGSMLLRRQ
jgi:N-methylhydantoinase A